MTQMIDRIVGDAREVLPTLPADSVHCCVTSPPYWGLRDYGIKGQIGMEATPEEYVAELVKVFREVRRILRPEGTLWLNLGDAYVLSQPPPGGLQRKGLVALELGRKAILIEINPDYDQQADERTNVTPGLALP